MKVQKLLPILERLNRDFKRDEIKGLQYPIDFFIIAPQPNEHHLILERFWDGIDDGVPLNELIKGISGEATIYAKYHNDKTNDFVILDSTIINSIGASLIEESFIKYIENKLGYSINMIPLLQNTLKLVSGNIIGNIIKYQYLYDICNDYQIFCYVYQDWKLSVNIVLDKLTVASNVSLSTLGIQLPIPDDEKEYAKKLIDDMDLKCGFVKFDIYSLGA